MPPIEYKNLVLQLLREKKYPVILDHVLLHIYYKQFEPSDIGIQYPYTESMEPEVIFKERNEPYNLVYLTQNDRYFYLHKQSLDQFKTIHLPLHCKRLKIHRGIIESHLKLKKKSSISFEHEIYLFLSYLNYNIPKIKELLALNYVECTTFIPVRIKMYIYNYDVKNIEGNCRCFDSFGPKGEEILQVRLLEGQLSNASAKILIISLRDHKYFESELKNEPNRDLVQNILNYNNMYNIYYTTDHKSLIALAYNPLENPIIGGG